MIDSKKEYYLTASQKTYGNDVETAKPYLYRKYNE